MNGVVTAGIAFLVTVTLVPLLVRFAVGRNLLDMPNPRSSHEIPTPRLGGLAIIVGVWIGALLLRPDGAWTVLIAATLAGVLGLADDFSDLHFAPKASGQIAVALTLVLVAPPYLVDAAGSLVPLALALAVLWLVALMNSFNFMDGIDGITGSTALVSALFLTVLPTEGKEIMPAFAGAVLGFLAWNTAPARIFMGDSGSYFVGFLLGGVALYTGADATPLTPLAGMIIFTPYLIDTAYTLARRLRARKNIFVAHREHIYQRITPSPVFHRQVSILYGSLFVVSGIAATLVARGGWYALLGLTLCFACCCTIVLLPRIWPEERGK
jgi:UDP-N-acetylmuramyl pentapeptide phosphotransferase/UDP-N-acetylglucosamine-1-phosphate transferase